MTYVETRDYLDGLPLVTALWWYIENINEDDPYRTDLFFHLRERVRNHDPKAEYKFTRELALRERGAKP